MTIKSLWSQVETNPYPAQCFSCEVDIPPGEKFVALLVPEHESSIVKIEVIICRKCVHLWHEDLNED